MRWLPLPDSLFGRLYVAIIAVVAITLLTIFALIVRERLQLLDTSGDASVARIAETAEHLAQLPADQRERALDEIRKRQRDNFEEWRRARFEGRRENRGELERTVVTQLQRRLGDQYQVHAAPPGGPRRGMLSFDEERGPGPETQLGEPPRGGPPGFEPRFGETLPRGGPPPEAGRTGPPPFDRRPFEIEIELPDGDHVAFRMPAPRGGPPLPRQILVDFGILTLILGAVLYGMTRTITRPLGKLANAADAVGRGERVEALPEEGGRELRAATRAFNSMQERLHRYLDSRTRVLAAMSHDLRTPLTRLRLRVESIEDEQLRARCSADLDEMNRMIRGALGVFRGLNDDESAIAIDLNALLAELRDEFGELGGTVAVSGRATEAFVGKPLALKRCIGNLIHNAIQYGEEANVAIEDGDPVTIRVRDRGRGIPDEALDQVFEPFFRLESSRNRDTGGTGLGLSIARDVAQVHGGSLVLRNVEPGLEACLTLPRRAGSLRTE